jgi:hypothetical protein
LDQNFQLILLALKESDEQVKHSPVQQLVARNHLVQNSQVNGGVLRAKLEIAGFRDNAFNPTNNSHCYYREFDAVIQRVELGYDFRGTGIAAADGVHLLDGLHCGFQLLFARGFVSAAPTLADAHSIRQKVHVLWLVFGIKFNRGPEKNVDEKLKQVWIANQLYGGSVIGTVVSIQDVNICWIKAVSREHGRKGLTG